MINVDGTDLHRITSERNGADRPQIDPLTGRIVYSRWWRNFRLAANDMATLADPAGGYRLKDGLVVANESNYLGDVPGGPTNINRNAWHLASINPDGTGLALWGIGSSTFLLGEDANFSYGGDFASDGSFYGNFFPMKNGTEASGFGGIRHYQPGMSGSYRSLIGITSEIGYEPVSKDPVSYGVNKGNYAAEPAVLENDRLVISMGRRYQSGLWPLSAQDRWQWSSVTLRQSWDQRIARPCCYNPLAAAGDYRSDHSDREPFATHCNPSL